MRIIILKKNIVYILILVIFAASYLIFASNTTAHEANSQTNGYIALIIDDFGNNGDGTSEILGLDIPLTISVMPFLPFSEADALAAHSAGKEVMLHLAMEPIKGKASWLGPRGITTAMNDMDIRAVVDDGLKQVRWAKGINNHMGSKICQDEHAMTSILTAAKDHEIFFIDSVTAEHSVVGKIADAIGVPCMKRDVFLDNSKTQSDIEKQLAKLADVAEHKGYAIGIGHVGPEGGKVTAKAIKAAYPAIEKKGIQFVFVTQLIDIYSMK